MDWVGDVVFNGIGEVVGMGDYSINELNAEQKQYIAGMQNVTNRIMEEAKKSAGRKSESTLRKIEDECYADAFTYMKEVVDLEIGEAIVCFVQQNGISHEPVFSED